MAKGRGLQHWLETGAEWPTFAIVLVCALARAAQFYSGGAFTIEGLLGRSFVWFNLATGLGLAFGAEILGSMSGRAARRYESEMREVEGRPGLRKAERVALVAHYRGEAQVRRRFMYVGLIGSAMGAMSYMWTANANHSPAALLAEGLATVLLVAVPFYLAVYHVHIAADPEQVAAERAANIRLQVTEQAGQRIAGGAYTPQDVALFAEALPRNERARFRAMAGGESEDDPRWTAREVAQWLGDDGTDLSLRRLISRRLRAALDAGQDIRRNERDAYTVKRSVVLQLFATDFLERSAAGLVRVRLPSRPRQSAALKLEYPAEWRHGRDTDATATA